MAVFVTALLLRLPAVWLYVPHSGSTGGEGVGGWLEELNNLGIPAMLITLFVVYFQAMYINKLCIDHDVLYTPTYLPAYIYILITSLFPAGLFLSPALVSLLFVIPGLGFLMRLYQSGQSAILVFYSGLFFGIASLIIPEFLTAPLFLVVATMAFKNISIRDFLAIITGVIMPWLMVSMVIYLIGLPLYKPAVSVSFTLGLGKEFVRYIPLVLFILISIAGIAKSGMNYFKNNIRTRRINLLFIAFFIYALIIILFRYQSLEFYHFCISIPAGIFTSYFLLGSKGKKWKNFVNYILLMATLFSLYNTQIPGL
ncbi:MAG: hypothetical protein JNL57_00520 [Bacteroidetes bacterium]|nr:hypothetical protein [Bacteroidota bacterium]